MAAQHPPAGQEKVLTVTVSGGGGDGFLAALASIFDKAARRGI
ncbi:hypothetical protein [Labrenzia sp. 5N]|nr:hypothetical protein [Labrenzia sp. 5N]